jgi:hypothetical protein
MNQTGTLSRTTGGLRTPRNELGRLDLVAPTSTNSFLPMDNVRLQKRTTLLNLLKQQPRCIPGLCVRLAEIERRACETYAYINPVLDPDGPSSDELNKAQ